MNKSNILTTATFHSSEGDTFTIDLRKQIDLTIGVQPDKSGVSFFNVPHPDFTPVSVGDFTGSVKLGASCNCYTLTFCAHTSGTHTEGIGHLTEEMTSVLSHVKGSHFLAKLITIPLETLPNNNLVISKKALGSHLTSPFCEEALIIRTLPNEASKQSRNYSETNSPYLHRDAAKYLSELDVQHLLVDLPSLDREDGEIAHMEFFNLQNSPRKNASITEFIFVPEEVPDGNYILFLNLPDLPGDAVPSRPLIYPLISGLVLKNEGTD